MKTLKSWWSCEQLRAQQGNDTLMLLILILDEYAYRIPNRYATLVHQGKGTEYPR